MLVEFRVQNDENLNVILTMFLKLLQSLVELYISCTIFYLTLF